MSNKMALIRGGTYELGTDDKLGFSIDNENSLVQITLKDFYIDKTPVTNKDFEEFVKATGYVTESEEFGWSFVFHSLMDENTKQNSAQVQKTPWWFAVEGAYWKKPEGTNSSIEERMDHPVVHVSQNDAIAYCEWAGKRLPTEAEWEVAAKGGTKNTLYPWGNEKNPNGKFYANVWQGKFPYENDQLDGYLGTAPVETYIPNGYGLYQVIGNVWEWCSNPARINFENFQYKDGDFYWNQLKKDDKDYAIKGGSFLCHPSYCKRDRISARNGNSASSASSNLSFRCVKV